MTVKPIQAAIIDIFNESNIFKIFIFFVGKRLNLREICEILKADN